ncbi:MAG TPA: lipoyl(octanoyl) transferase LipB [Bryobacteraceae bacterium]|nr:lipoyl(octanoyl) transferase LipB [Bryobacteraceae bacterium]
MRPLEVLHLGRLPYGQAFEMQQSLVERRKGGEGRDTLLFVEHPHTVTIGRNGKEEHVLASCEALTSAGIEFHETDRGGDVTYHGPGQIIGYPIIDLREWKRDVHAYFAGVEQALIDALAVFGIEAGRIPQRGYEGVWVNGAKIAAIGIHISRWITSHGFALNLDTDLSYFKYIVPCGLTKPVCSLQSLGSTARRAEVTDALAASFANVFGYQLMMANEAHRIAASRLSEEIPFQPAIVGRTLVRATSYEEIR